MKDTYGPQCKGTGDDEIPVIAGEVIYGWADYYGGCWVGIDGECRTVYVPDEGPGSLPGCADPATEPQPEYAANDTSPGPETDVNW